MQLPVGHQYLGPILPRFRDIAGVLRKHSSSRWNFDDMFRIFRDITTSGWLAVILDF